jgi:hypothetical protein
VQQAVGGVVARPVPSFDAATMEFGLRLAGLTVDGLAAALGHL